MAANEIIETCHSTTEPLLTRFGFMDLVQVESLAVVLYQIVSDDGTCVVLQRLKVPGQVERVLFGYDFLGVLLLAVLQPLVFATTPVAVVPYFSHETTRLLEDTFFIVPPH